MISPKCALSPSPSAKSGSSKGGRKISQVGGHDVIRYVTARQRHAERPSRLEAERTKLFVTYARKCMIGCDTRSKWRADRNVADNALKICGIETKIKVRVHPHSARRE